ncbi:MULTISPECIES: DnaT-like ssDNA-binding protein [Pseudomonas]|uniref:DnaT-like ssDNA-binding protein n=1 Tax=Pseudomonas TaxID=286 RepID=UPI003002E0BB
MALVIEDGSIVPGADSFSTAAELVTYAANYGLTIPTDETAQESLLRRGYLEMTSMPWKGHAVSPDQTGAWPRYGVCRSGFTIASDVIPAQVKQGQMALAAEIHADDLDPPEQRTGAVTKERVEGAIDTQYAAASSKTLKPTARKQSSAQFVGLIESSSQIKLSRG